MDDGESQIKLISDRRHTCDNVTCWMTGVDKSRQKQTRADNSRQEQTRAEKSRQEQTRADKNRQEHTKAYKSRQEQRGMYAGGGFKLDFRCFSLLYGTQANISRKTAITDI